MRSRNRIHRLKVFRGRAAFRFARAAAGVAALVALLIAIPASDAAAESWILHQQMMASKQGQIKKLEEEIAELIHHKRAAQSPAAAKAITDEMAKKHAELAKIAKEYREEFLHIRFRHPERGDESERKYSDYKLRSLKEMEYGFGLDSKLDRIKKRIRKTFGVAAAGSSPETGAADTAAAKQDAPGATREHHSGALERQPASHAPAPDAPAEADQRIRLRK